MGFRTNRPDEAEGVGYVGYTSAEFLLSQIESKLDDLEIQEDKNDVNDYGRNVYKVTIIIEKA